jgi:hypothetical protein
MSDITNRSISNYEELKAEEARLQATLRDKKLQIQQDIKSLKDEFKPVLAVAKFIGKITSPEGNSHSVAHAGTNLGIDFLAKQFLPRGSFLLKLLIPKIVKNYTSGYVDKVVDKAAPALRRFGTKLQESARK